MEDFCFTFMDKPYRLSDLTQAKVVKTYWIHVNSFRKMVEDKYGRKYHYLYEIYYNPDAPDREQHLWVYVENEDDSDSLTDDHLATIRRNYSVFADEAGLLEINEGNNTFSRTRQQTDWWHSLLAIFRKWLE